MSLPSEQFRALQHALLDGFANQEALEGLGRRHLDLRLADICAPADLPRVCNALIEWAEQHGRVVDLVVGALAERPEHAGLAACARALCVARPAGVPAFTLVTARTSPAFVLVPGHFYIIGRDPHAQITVPRGDHKASARHAMLEVAAWGVVIRDLGSKNRVFVNEQPVKSHLCRPGDSIRVGRTVFLLQGYGQADGEAPIALPTPITETETETAGPE